MPNSTNPFDAYFQNGQAANIQSDIMAAPAPDVMAAQTRTARQAGLPTTAVIGIEPDVERSIRAQRMAQVAQQHPPIGAWAAQNPRGAVAASDDHQALGILGSAWQTLKATWNPVLAFAAGVDAFDRQDVGSRPGLTPAPAIMAGVAALMGDQQAIRNLPSTVKAAAAVGTGVLDVARWGTTAPAWLGDAMGLDRRLNAFKAADDALSAAADWLRPRSSSWVQEQILGGIENAPSIGATLAGGVSLRALGLSERAASIAAVAVPSLQQGGDSYFKARDEGVGAGMASIYGALDTLAEAGGEYLGEKAFVHSTGAGDSVLKRWIKSQIPEIAGEVATTLAEDTTAHIFLPENRDKTLGDLVAQFPGDAAATALQTLVGGGLANATLGGVERVMNAAAAQRRDAVGTAMTPHIARAIQGLRDASILDAFNRAGADSKFKARDPEGYRDLVGFLSKEAGVDQVYVSPDAIRAYQQSDSYDAFADPFHDYADAIHEAEATGSDVALPVEFVLGDLAGTKAGDAIRDGIRLRADGLTGGEARELADKLPDVARETFDRLSEQDKAAAQESDTRAALVERLTGEIQNAGYTPRNAAIMAELVAQRAATRAARLGRTLQPGDFDTRIVRVLPPSLEGMRKTDQIDLVINALRKGKPVETQSGKTLLEWIAARGGINDSGGDLKSMGLDRWHLNDKGKRPVPIRGRRPILRDFDPRQSSMGGISGEGDFGHDSTLRSAVEAGYFPELEHVPVGELDTNYLLAAIADEQAGRPRYAEAPKVDPVRAAADDLRRMIEAEGRDPSGMTDAEIRKLIEDVSARPVPGGRAFEQPKAPIATVQGDEIAPKTVHGADLRKQTIAWYQDHLRGHSVRSKALAHDVEFASPKKMRAFSADEEKLRAVAVLPAIIENGDLVSSRPPYDLAREPSIKAYHTLRANIEIGGASKSVDVLIREANNGHFYYDHALPENAARNPESPDDKTGTGEPSSYAQFTASGDNFNMHMQGEESGPRGRILLPADGWGSAPATIELFQHANLSTLTHELGHQWLEELRFDAQHPEASDQLKADWAAAQKWFADHGHLIGEDGVIPTDAHEMWARGIERYLLEGKAPATGIARVFEAIRGWMTRIYKSVLDLHSPINPEIRQVFDRLLATDDEIKAQTDALAMHPAITDPKALGMSDAEAAQYRALAERARDNAHGALLEQTMAAIRRQRTAEWQEQRARVRSEEATRLEEGPLFTALRLMKDQPISREWVVDRMGEDAVALLPKRVPPMVKEGGAHPDDIAEMAGFDSGEQMLEVLLGAERAHRAAKEAGDARTLRNRIIDTATDAEMQRRHGDDPLNDGSIEEEAIAAVNNDLAGKLLETELRYLGRTTGRPATAYDAARAWARSKVRQGTVAAEAMAGAVQRYSRAVAKAGRDAEKALIAGDMNAAFEAKQRQQLSAALLSEAKAAHDEVTKAQDRLARIAKRKTMKSVDQDYLDQAHALLDDVDLGPRSQRSIDRQGRWEAWARQQEADGRDVVVPASFEATITGKHWTRLTVEQFLGLRDAVDQVMHLGKLKQTLLDGQEERTWEAIYSEAEQGARNLSGPPPKEMADLAAPGALQRIKDGLASADAMLLRMETIFDWLDGGNSNGVFNRIAFKPIADAQFREHEMLKDYLGATKDLIEAVPAEDRARWFDRMTMPWADTRTGRPMVLTRQQVIAMALNIGNEGNLQRLADGYRINAGALQDHLNATLTKGEWQFVQGVWDKINELWPAISELERRVNGVAPDKVEPRAFDTPHGPMRGGYYPAVYDATLDQRAEQHGGEASDLLDAKFTRATTRSSSTKDRAEQVKAPILLDLGVINRHLAEVIHDITHREAVIQAWRFLGSERVQSAVKEALGPAYAAQFRPWVKAVANSMAVDRTGNEGFGKFLRRARMNVTMVGLGLRATTILVHTSGLAAGASVIGEKAMAHGLATMAKNPVAATRMVLESSAEVRGHLEHYERDIGTMIDRLDTSRPTVKAQQLIHDGQRFALYGIGWIVQRTSVPVWIGAHDKAISEGMSEADARFAADKAVRYSLGAGGIKDQVAVQRSGGRWGEAIKMLTMFYTAMASQYQRHRTLVRDATGVDARRPRDLSKLASRAFWGVAMVPIWDEIIRMAITGHGPDDDEWWSAFVLKKFLANLLGPIPLARDVFEPTWDGIAGHSTHGVSITPLQGIYDSVGRSSKDVGHLLRGEPTKRATRDILETSGYLTGLVPGQFAAASQFLVDVANGSEHPESVRDWINGLSTGHVPKHKA